MCSTLVREYYSALKRKEILRHTATEENSNFARKMMNVSLRERSQTRKATHRRIYLYERSKISKLIKTENKLVAARGWEAAGMGTDRLINTGFSFRVERTLWN